MNESDVKKTYVWVDKPVPLKERTTASGVRFGGEYKEVEVRKNDK